MLFATSKSYIKYLFTIHYYLLLAKNRQRNFSEKWKVKSEEWKSKNRQASVETCRFLWIADKKDILGSFRMDLNSRTKSRPEASISSKRSFVYHQGESLVYHHCERGCSLRLMIYSLWRDMLVKADEMHAKAWWYAIAFAMDKKIRQVKTCRIFCERAIKKIFLPLLVWVWTVGSQSRQRRVYHQNEVLYIAKAKALYIIIAKEDTACGWWYTRLVEIYSARRMRYTLKRDDMPLLSQWIKKFDKSKLVEFFGGDEEILLGSLRVPLHAQSF